jgi:hypothetical protein
MSSPRITYAPRAGTTPEEEVSALAAVYRFIVLDCHAEKKAVPDGRPNDAERRSDEIDANAIVQRTA